MPQIKKVLNTTLFLEQNTFFHTNMKNNNTCKLVCKMQCLKMDCDSMYQKVL